MIGEHFNLTAAMKNLFKKTMLFAAAAMAFVSCENDTTDVNTLPGVDVTINATTEGTKSHFGDYNATDKTYPTLWDGTEKWAVCLNDKKVDAEEIEFSNGNTAASATVTFNEPEAYNGKYTLFAVSPLARFVSVSMASDYIRFRVPGSQTPSATSCDAAAQVLIAQSEASETVSGFDVTFKHATAYGKFSFINVAEGGNVTGVTIKNKAADVALAGRYVYAPSTKTISFKDEAAYEINLQTNTTTDLWFACGPAQVQGKKLTFIINTDKGNLEKEVTMPGNFVAGRVATFKIDMAGIEYPVVEEVIQYKKVTSLADITAGEYVIVHEVNSKMFVLPNTTATGKSQVSQIQLSSKATINSDILTNVKDEVKWVLTGSTSAMKIKSYANEKDYLYTTNDNNGLRISPNDNSSTITWAIEAYKTGFSIKDSKNSRYCGVYTSGTDWRTYTSHHSNYGSNGAALTFYKKVSGGNEGGETPSTPAPELTITTTAPIEVGAEGDVATVKYTITNPVDGQSVTASADQTWVNNFDYTVAGEVSFAVDANTGEAREATVTLSYDGATPQTIKISQAAAQQGGGDEPATKVWTLVTDASTLKAGDQIIIACNSKAVTASNTIVSGSNPYLDKITSTFSSDKTTITSVGSGTAILTLGGSAGAWTLTNESGKKLGTTAAKKVAWGSGTTTWAITISSNNATIQSTTSTYGRFLYNVTSPRFTTYTSNTTSSMLLPQIYRLQ